MNARQKNYKYNFAPTVSSHYPLKLKPHKHHILKSVVKVFHYSTKE